MSPRPLTMKRQPIVDRPMPCPRVPHDGRPTPDRESSSAAIGRLRAHALRLARTFRRRRVLDTRPASNDSLFSNRSARTGPDPHRGRRGRADQGNDASSTPSCHRASSACASRRLSGYQCSAGSPGPNSLAAQRESPITLIQLALRSNPAGLSARIAQMDFEQTTGRKVIDPHGFSFFIEWHQVKSVLRQPCCGTMTRFSRLPSCRIVTGKFPSGAGRRITACFICIFNEFRQARMAFVLSAVDAGVE